MLAGLFSTHEEKIFIYWGLDVDYPSNFQTRFSTPYMVK